MQVGGPVQGPERPHVQAGAGAGHCEVREHLREPDDPLQLHVRGGQAWRGRPPLRGQDTLRHQQRRCAARHGAAAPSASFPADSAAAVQHPVLIPSSYTPRAGCDPNALECTNTTTGSRSLSQCGRCMPGFTGSGETECVPVDWCAVSRNDTGAKSCSWVRTCVPTLRSSPFGNETALFKCGDCPLGYRNDGATDCAPCGTSFDFSTEQQSGVLIQGPSDDPESGGGRRFQVMRSDYVYLAAVQTEDVSSCNLEDGLSFYWDANQGRSRTASAAEMRSAGIAVNISQPFLPRLILPPRTLFPTDSDRDASVSLTVCVAGSDDEELCSLTGVNLQVDSCAPLFPSPLCP